MPIEPEVEIAGYITCPCGERELAYVAQMTGGVCFAKCFVEGRMRNLRSVEIQHRDGRTRVPIPRRPRGPNKGSKATRHKVEHAQRVALKRLRWLFPDVFDVLYNEERAKRRLPLIPNREPAHLERAVATYEASRSYYAGDQEGEDGDAQPEDQDR